MRVTITLPDGDDQAWGETYNTAITDIKNAINSLGASADKGVGTGADQVASGDHTHGGYASEGHNHDEAYSPEGHKHTFQEIEGLSNLGANCQGTTPTVVPSGLGTQSHSLILNVSGISCLSSWIIGYTYNNSIYSQGLISQTTQIQIAKPPADSNVWVNGKANVTITIQQKNVINNSVSDVVSITLEVWMYNYISMDALVQQIVAHSQFVTAVGNEVAQKAIIEAYVK